MQQWFAEHALNDQQQKLTKRFVADWLSAKSRDYNVMVISQQWRGARAAVAAAECEECRAERASEALKTSIIVVWQHVAAT